MNKNRILIFKIILTALFLSLAMVLPFISGSIPEIGSMLCLMHLPVILSGFLCGPFCGLAVGAFSPILRSCWFGTPILVPNAICMALELGTYGFVCGLLYKLFPKKIGFIYVSLIVAMIFGRIIWGISRFMFFSLGEYKFSWEMFWSGAFLSAIPGITIQIVLIPILLVVLNKISPTVKEMME